MGPRNQLKLPHSICAFFCFLFSIQNFAHGTPPLSQCEATYLTKQEEESKQKLSKEQRLNVMDQLLGELLLLNQIDVEHADVPVRFITECRNKKIILFQIHCKNSDSSTIDSYRYSVIVAKFFENQRNFKSAQVYFEKAASLDPSDYFSQKKSWTLWEQVQAARLHEQTQGGVSPKEFDDIAAKSKRLLDALVNNSKAPISDRSEAINHWAQFLYLKGQVPEAMEQYKRVLKLDSHNEKALIMLTDFELSRDRKAEARKLLEALAPMRPADYAIQFNLIDLQLKDQDYNAALNSAKLALKQFPTSIEIKAQLAAAYQGSGRSEEARTLNSVALKSDPKNKLARNTASLLHEAQGDKWHEESLLGKALAEYQLALDLKPENPDLRNKMASIIFEYRKNEDFQNDSATKKDLDKVLELIEPEVSTDQAATARMELYILAAQKSSAPARGAPICSRYLKIFGSLNSMGLVMGCVEIYRAASMPNRAKDVIETSLKNPRFKSDTKRLGEALRRN